MVAQQLLSIVIPGRAKRDPRTQEWRAQFPGFSGLRFASPENDNEMWVL
jgi:hypothetical protein